MAGETLVLTSLEAGGGGSMWDLTGWASCTVFFFNLSAVLPGMWIFVLLPGMEPTPSVLTEGILATGPRGESLHLHFYPRENLCSCCGLDYW